MDSKGEDGMTKFQAQYSCGSHFYQVTYWEVHSVLCYITILS